MKVLLATHNYPRFPGDPAGAFIARLARGLAEENVTVRVLAPHGPGLPESETSGTVHLRRFRYGPESLESVAYSGTLHHRPLRSPRVTALLPFFLYGFRRALNRERATFQPDLIHAHWWIPAGLVTSGVGTSYVVTCHGSDVRLLETRVARLAARPVFRRAAVVTAVSRFLCDDLRRLLGRDANEPAVLRMPVDTAHFQRGRLVAKATPARILYVGNLLASKGVDVLLRALRVLLDRSVACGLRIVGDGPARTGLERLARDLRLGPAVEWAGWVGQPRMPEEYGAATVTALPTRGQAEGLGLVLVEALLAGSAVVGSAAGGIPEVIQDGETGLIARDGDVVHWTNQLERMLTDAALRERTITLGSERMFGAHSAESIVPQLLQFYRAAIDQPAH